MTAASAGGRAGPDTVARDAGAFAPASPRVAAFVVVPVLRLVPLPAGVFFVGTDLAPRWRRRRRERAGTRERTKQRIAMRMPRRAREA